MQGNNIKYAFLIMNKICSGVFGDKRSMV